MSALLARLHAPARLALFGSLLVLAFAIAFAVGRAVNVTPPAAGMPDDAHAPARVTQQEIGNEHA